MLITESTAPSYETLRPRKSLTSGSFPVYGDLVDRLVAADVPDPTVAHVLATCSAYAYGTNDTLAMIMARLGLDENRCLEITEVVDALLICATAFLVQSRDGRLVILCFRGTAPLNAVNWLIDVDINPERVPVTFPDGRQEFDVHGGFYRNVRAIRYEIVNALDRALDGRSVHTDGGSVPNPMRALYVTGHSLGGAMAALMAVMLATEEAYVPLAERWKAAYTFGQPMLGDPRLAAACDAHELLSGRVVRYVYGNDVVAQLPPAFAGPFLHFGREYRHRSGGPEGSWERHPGITRQLRNPLHILTAPLTFLARQLPAFRRVVHPASLDDHFPRHYVAGLTPAGVRSEFGD
ncbi:MAG TPA: lipase family protein [Acidimicrobiales bacterium]|nr:lipase family protein [Acidimicrobiales bacterium]